MKTKKQDQQLAEINKTAAYYGLKIVRLGAGWANKYGIEGDNGIIGRQFASIASVRAFIGKVAV